jgi:hypothetical protein
LPIFSDDIKPEFSSKIELLKNLKPVYVTITKLSTLELEKYKANSERQLNGSIMESVDLNSSSKLSNQKLKSIKKLNNMKNTRIDTIDLSSEDEQVTVQIVPSSKEIKDISSFEKNSNNDKDDVNVISLPNHNLDHVNELTDKLDKIARNAIMLKDVSERKYDKEDEDVKEREETENADATECHKIEGGKDEKVIEETTGEQIVDLSILEKQINLHKKWSPSLNVKYSLKIYSLSS